MADDKTNIDIRIKATIDAAQAAKTLGDLKKSSKDLVELYEKSDFGSKQFQQLGKELDKVDSKIIKNQKGINDFVKSLGGLGKGMSIFASSIPEATAGVEAFQLALDATGIGLITGAIVLFGVALAKTEPVMDKIKEAFNVISAVVGVIIERLGSVAKAIFAFFKRDYKEAAKDLHESIDGIGDALDNAAKGAKDATKAQIKLEEVHAKNTKQLALLNKQLQKQKTLMKEQGKDQKKYAKEAIATQKQITAIHVSEAQTELQIFEDQKKGRKDLTREEVQQEADLQSKVIDLQAEGEAAQRRAEVELNNLEEKDRKDKEKKVQELEDNERTRRKSSIDLEKDSLDKRLKLYDLESEKEEEVQRKAGTSEETITEQRNTQIAAITQKFNDDQQKIADKKALEESKRNEEALKQIQENRDKQLEIEKKYKQSQKQIDDAFEQNRRDNANLTDSQIYALIQKNLQDTVDAEEKKKKKKEELEKESFETAKSLMQAINSLADLFSQLDQQRGAKTLKEKNKIALKEFKTKKALGIVSAAINTAESVTKALTSADPPLNYVFAALNAVAGIAEIATIASKKFTPEAPASGAGSTSTPSFGGGGSSGGSSQFQPSSFQGLGGVSPSSSQSQPNQQVYVTTTDLSNAQNKVSVVTSRSKIG